MTRTLRQVDAWINAHVKDHVLSGHTHAHSHPLTPHEHPHTHEPEPPLTPPTGTLQQIIDGTQSGGSVDLTGWSGQGIATITKPITIKGGQVLFTSGKALSVNSPGVTLDGLELAGSGSAYAGIWAMRADGLRVLDCPIHDVSYAGIMVLETVGGEISRNTVQRVGMGQPNGTNAYGIALSSLGGPETEGFVVDANLVEDVPTWGGIDTHSGRRQTWTNNITRRVRRAYWITAPRGRPSEIVLRGNRAEQVPQPYYDPTAYFVSHSDNCEFVGNSLSPDYPVGSDAEWHNFVRDYGGASIGLVSSGNVRS